MHRSSACLASSSLRAMARRRAHPADAKSRRQRLRETAEIDDAPVAVVGRDRPRVGLACVTSGKYRSRYGSSSTIEHVAPLGPLEQLPALLRADEQQPVGFWKFGTRYRNLTRRPSGAQRCQRRVQVIEVDAVCVLPHADERRPDVAERRDRAGVDGSSISTTSPGSSSTRAIRSSPCCEPVVTTTRSAVARDAAVAISADAWRRRSGR